MNWANKISPYALLVLALVGLTTLQAQVEQQPDTLRFDPLTGEPLKPESVLKFDPLTGLPIIEETEPDTTLQFDPETGLPVKARPAEPMPIEAEPEAPAQPRFDPKTRELIPPEPAEPEPVITAEPDAGQEVSRPPAVGPKFFPLQFTVGLSPKGGGSNLGISYRFSKPIGVKVPSVLGKVMIHPVVTVGILGNYESTYDMHQSENTLYGLVEGHQQWAMQNLRASIFLGAGLGRYYRYETRYGDEYNWDRDEGIGLVLSAGAQVRLRRLTGDLRLYRTPGLGKFIPMANVGYQPKSKTVAGCVVKAVAGCAVGCVGLLIFGFMFGF